MKPCAFLAAAGAALAGCASLQPSSAYVGRPIADAVRELGPPESIADYEAGGRFFSWSTSDVIIADYGVDNPANWLEPMNRASAPEKLDEEKLVSLPDYIVSPPFRAPSPWLPNGMPRRRHGSHGRPSARARARAGVAGCAHRRSDGGRVSATAEVGKVVPSARVRARVRARALPLTAVLASPPDSLRAAIPAGMALAGWGGVEFNSHGSGTSAGTLAIGDFGRGDDVRVVFNDFELGSHVRLLRLQGSRTT